MGETPGRASRGRAAAAVATALALLAAGGGAAASRSRSLGPQDAPLPVALTRGVGPLHRGPDALSYHLWVLAETHRRRGPAAARAYARQQGIRLVGGQAAVLIHADAQPSYSSGMRPGSTAAGAEEALFEALGQAIARQVGRYGGRVRGRSLNLVEATVPVPGLVGLARAREIAWVEPTPAPRVDAVVSQGVRVVGADELQRSPSATHQPGEGRVRVAVLDVGFLGVDGLLGSELPPTISSRSFHAGGITGSGQEFSERLHGTAVAEIVFDMAPEADLVLTNVDSVFAHSQATSWLLSQDVDVVVNTLSWFNVGPGDGRGPINFDVQRAVAAGVEWVVAAGNQQDRHWQGTFSDPDRDGWHNFRGAKETNPVRLPAFGSLTVFLNWDDWFRSSQDYDLHIFFECSFAPRAVYPCPEDEESGLTFPTDGGPLRLEASSSNRQRGRQPPVESVTVRALRRGVVAHVAIRRVSASRNVRFEAFHLGEIVGPPRFLVRDGSLTVPADTEGAITVGATFWQNDELEPFSSLGPTVDGRTKPDIVAPDFVDTVSFGPSAFPGTSAAAAHVGGAIALLKARFGLYTLDEVVAILMGRAIDKGPPGKDNRFGVGRLDLRGRG